MDSAVVSCTTWQHCCEFMSVNKRLREHNKPTCCQTPVLGTVVVHIRSHALGCSCRVPLQSCAAWSSPKNTVEQVRLLRDSGFVAA